MADTFKRLTLTMRSDAYDAIREAAYKRNVTDAAFVKGCVDLVLGFDPWAWETFERFRETFDIPLSLALEHWGLAALARGDARSKLEGGAIASMNELLEDFMQTQGTAPGKYRAVRGKRYFGQVLEREKKRLVSARCEELRSRHPLLKLRPEEIKFLETFKELIPAAVRREILLRLGDEDLARRINAELEAERATAEDLPRFAAEARATITIPEGLTIDDAALGRLYKFYKDGVLSSEGLADQLEGMTRIDGHYRRVPREMQTDETPTGNRPTRKDGKKKRLGE